LWWLLHGEYVRIPGGTFGACLVKLETSRCYQATAEYFQRKNGFLHCYLEFGASIERWLLLWLSPLWPKPSDGNGRL
jgi:hypothetical protein